MQQLRTHMDIHGRVLIPANLRKELGYKPGDTFVLRSINGELRLVSLEKTIANIQAEFKKYIQPGVSVVDEFLQMRQEERQLEEAKYNRICGHNNEQL